MVKVQPRNVRGKTIFWVWFGTMTWTESELFALQVESLLRAADALAPGRSTTGLAGADERTAGCPSGAPARRSCAPGKPVIEQVAADLLVNDNVAYWWPLRPEPRWTPTVSAAVAHAGGPTGGTVADVEAVGVGRVELAVDDAAVLLGGTLALVLAELLSGVDDDADTEVLPLTVGDGALVQPAKVMTATALPTMTRTAVRAVTRPRAVVREVAGVIGTELT